MSYIRGLPKRPRRVRVRHPASSEEEDEPIVYSLTVYDDTPEWIDTGLVSPEGARS